MKMIADSKTPFEPGGPTTRTMVVSGKGRNSDGATQVRIAPDKIVGLCLREGIRWDDEKEAAVSMWTLDVQTVGPVEYRVEFHDAEKAREMVDTLDELLGLTKRFRDDGDWGAGDLASSILESLKIEWI